MARTPKATNNKNKAITDSTATQQTQDIKGINTPLIYETLLKTHSMASQTQENTDKAVNIEEMPNKYEPVGRPPVNIDYDKLTEYASQPISNKEIAKALDMSVSTFYKYMREDTIFKQAYENGMDNRKYELEKALYKRATGFEAQEVVTEKDEKGNLVKTKITDKSYVPDTTAAIFALKNVYSEKYKDRIETVTDININFNQIQALTNEELAKLASNAMIEVDYSIEWQTKGKKGEKIEF